MMALTPRLVAAKSAFLDVADWMVATALMMISGAALPKAMKLAPAMS